MNPLNLASRKRVLSSAEQLALQKKRLQERRESLVRAKSAKRELRVQNKRFLTQLSNPRVFDEYVNKIGAEFYWFFLKKKVRMPYFESVPKGKFPELSSTRAIAGIFGQLAKESGFIPLKNFPRTMPALLREQGIKSVLEIGPSGRGVIDLLIDSGIAQAAKLQLNVIDTHFGEKRLMRLRRNRVQAVRGNAMNISKEFNGKKFDLIIAVGVLGVGGQNGQSFKENAVSYSLNSHRIAKSAINSLTPNRNALFCATPILGLTTLRQKAVNRFAHIAQWSELTADNYEYARNTVFENMPRLPTLGLLSMPSEYHEARYKQYEWQDKNKRYYSYGQKLIKGAPSLVILKRK